jgi:hypothetical protein
MFIQIPGYKANDKFTKIRIDKINLSSVIKEKTFQKELIDTSISQIKELYKTHQITKKEINEIINYIKIILGKNIHTKNKHYSIKQLTELIEKPKSVKISQMKINKAEMFNRNEDNKKGTWVSYSKYVSYARVGNIPYDKISVIKALAKAIHGIKEGARLDTIIEAQSGTEYNEVIELISNGIDASTYKKIGRFGMGFQQVLDKLKGKEIIVRTKRKENNYVREVRFRNMGKGVENIEVSDSRYYVEDKYKGESGTRVEVKQNLSKEEQEAIRDHIKQKMKFNTVLPIYIDMDGRIELVNDPEEMKLLGGKEIEYLEKTKQVIISIDDKGYRVEDQGIGMSDEILYKHLLNPKHSTKEKGQNGENIRYVIDKESNNKCKVCLVLNGIVVEEHEITGLNLPEEMIIDLPVNTNLPSSRNEIEVNEIITRGIDRLILEIEKKGNGEAIKILNALIGEIRILEKRANVTRIMRDEIEKMKRHIKRAVKGKIEEQKEIVYLPNIRECGYIEIKHKKISYIDAEIYPIEMITRLEEVNKIEEFRSNKYKAYSVLMIEEEDTPVIIELGNIILVNKRVYELHKDKAPEAIDALINFYIGYGDPDPIKGELYNEKQQAKLHNENINNNIQLKTPEQKKNEILKKEIEQYLKTKGIDYDTEYINLIMSYGKSIEEIKRYLDRCSDINMWNETLVERIIPNNDRLKYIVENKDVPYIVGMANLGHPKFYILKNNKQMTNEWYDNVRDFAVAGKDVYCIAKQGQKYCILKNGQQQVTKEWNGEINDFIVVDKDVYCIAKQGQKYCILKNVEQVTNEWYDNVNNLVSAGKDVYCIAKQGQKYCILKNGVEVLKIVYTGFSDSLIKSNSTNWVYLTNGVRINTNFPKCVGELNKKEGQFVKDFKLGTYIEEAREVEAKYKKTIFNYGNFNLGEYFKNKCVGIGIGILGEHFKQYRDKGMMDNEWIKQLIVKYKDKEDDWWIQYWKFYELMNEVIDTKEKFKRFSERWDLICSLKNQELKDNFIEKLEKSDWVKYFKEDKEITDQEILKYKKFFTAEKVDILEEKKKEKYGEPEKVQSNNTLRSLVYKKRKKTAGISNVSKDEEEKGKQLAFEEIKQTIGSQSTGKGGWMKEIIQNSIDAIKGEEKHGSSSSSANKEIQIKEYIRKGTNDEGKKERVIEIKDPVGMNLKKILNELLIPDASTKVIDKDQIGKFGIGFFMIFREADVVEIRTGEGKGKFWEFRIRVKRDKNNDIKSINIEYVKEYKGHFKGTEIRQIKEYDEKDIMLAHIESLDTQYIIEKYCGGIISEEYCMEGENKKNIYNKTGINIRYNRQKLTQERELLGEVDIHGLGKLRILRNDNGKGCIEQNGLYVKEIDKTWLELVPDLIKNKILGGMEDIIIELPQGVPLVSSRNDIREKSKYMETLQKGIYTAMLRSSVYLYCVNPSKVKQYLPQDMYYVEEVYDAEQGVKTLADTLNKSDLGFDEKQIPQDDYTTTKLLKYVCLERDKGSVSINKLDAKVRANTLKEHDLKYLDNEVKKDINYAKGKSNEVLEKEKIPEISNEEKEYIGEFIKWIYKETGIGFKDVEFYYKNDNSIAMSGYPEYDEVTGEIDWIVKMNIKFLREFIKYFDDDKNIMQLVYKKERGALLEVIIHEYAHTREYEYNMRQILNLLNGYKKQNLSKKNEIREVKRMLKLYFISVVRGNRDAKSLKKLSGYLNELPIELQTEIIRLLGERKDFGIKYNWTHQKGTDMERSFAKHMKEALEKVVKSGIFANIKEAVNDIKLRVMFNIDKEPETIKEKIFNFIKQLINRLGYKTSDLSIGLCRAIKTSV